MDRRSFLRGISKPALALAALPVIATAADKAHGAGAAALQALKNQFGIEEAMLAVDTKAILERAIATQTGAGFVGKNTMFIAPGAANAERFHVGSFLFLAEIFLLSLHTLASA